MKQYFIGFFTGACLIASAFMFMGAGESNSKIGKYQGFSVHAAKTGIVKHLIDTETGQMWRYAGKPWTEATQSTYDELKRFGWYEQPSKLK